MGQLPAALSRNLSQTQDTGPRTWDTGPKNVSWTCWRQMRIWPSCRKCFMEPLHPPQISILLRLRQGPKKCFMELLQVYRQHLIPRLRKCPRRHLLARPSLHIDALLQPRCPQCDTLDTLVLCHIGNSVGVGLQHYSIRWAHPSWTQTPPRWHFEHLALILWHIIMSFFAILSFLVAEVPVL